MLSDQILNVWNKIFQQEKKTAAANFGFHAILGSEGRQGEGCLMSERKTQACCGYG